MLVRRKATHKWWVDMSLLKDELTLNHTSTLLGRGCDALEDK